MAPQDESKQIAQEREERYVEALQAEHAGYKNDPNKSDRADQVAAELRKHHAKPDDQPKQRQQPPTQTATTGDGSVLDAGPSPEADPVEKNARAGRGRLSD